MTFITGVKNDLSGVNMAAFMCSCMRMCGRQPSKGALYLMFFSATLFEYNYKPDENTMIIFSVLQRSYFI